MTARWNVLFIAAAAILTTRHRPACGLLDRTYSARCLGRTPFTFSPWHFSNSFDPPTVTLSPLTSWSSIETHAPHYFAGESP